ncbi:MAG: hypothetical protein JWN08_3082 [Frankiales bacterium]|jgi:hypothetical protein|nr:hypothetical protein [Frankiales bacterium]
MPSSLLTRGQDEGAVRQPGSRAAVANGLRTRREIAVTRPETLLWSPTVVTRWAGVTAVGVLVMFSAWYTVAGKSDWIDQRLGMGVGIAALVLVSFASLTLLVAGRRVIGMRRIELLGDLPLQRGPAQVVAQVITAGPSSDELVAGQGLLRFHRSDCVMAGGKGYQPADRATHAAAGRMACGVCQP